MYLFLSNFLLILNFTVVVFLYSVSTETEYANLTDNIYKEWLGMTAKVKNLEKKSLSDNMVDVDVILADLCEILTIKKAIIFL